MGELEAEDDGHGRRVYGNDRFLFCYYSYVEINRMRAGPGLVDIFVEARFGGLTLTAYATFLIIVSINSNVEYIRCKKKRGRTRLS